MNDASERRNGRTKFQGKSYIFQILNGSQVQNKKKDRTNWKNRGLKLQCGKVIQFFDLQKNYLNQVNLTYRKLTSSISAELFSFLHHLRAKSVLFEVKNRT